MSKVAMSAIGLKNVLHVTHLTIVSQKQNNNNFYSHRLKLVCDKIKFLLPAGATFSSIVRK